MVNKLFKVITAVLLTASLSHADGGDFFDIKTGMGTWLANAPSGRVGATLANSIDLPSVFAIEGGAQIYYWAEFQHFIPLIPHFRFEYANMTFNGNPSTSFDLGGQTYDFAGTAEMQAENVDFILFYDLDLFGVDFNYGIGAKIIAGQIVGEILGTETIVPIPGVAAYAYVDVRYEPMLGLGIEASYRWFPSGITDLLSFNEYIVKADYTFDFGVLKLGAEGGIRGMDLTISDGSALYLNQQFGGLFFGAFAKLGI